ncbi:MAG: hypothetical protein DBP02_01585 [gamma proteobacterium symbiont of Ctena orbiculata]|nr:MAG: hypothetical protein DBP02_01585 [gamma proteobacterium symbiont of Ctena orbiculata]
MIDTPILFLNMDLRIHWSGINGIFLVVDILKEISGMIKEISDLNQIVTATASEQNIVAREISANILSVGD